MARKFGKINQMSTKFEDYSYIINGVGGIGKTSLVYEIGKIITGSNEGTFIITCGGENKPKHIPGAFGDVAPDFKTFVAIVKELCDNKAEYPHTKFVAIDSLDEYARVTENAVVAEWNAQCDINDRAKNISQAYKGFQKGESRACDLMIQQIMKLQNAGYSVLEIGHTRIKTKEDVLLKTQFEQLTCNLDNKYYNALKDKVNLVCMCYWENVIENVEERKNAFTKKMDRVGELKDRKRVMVFADEDNVIDTKTHFEYITQKIDLSAEGLIKAVEEAIAMKVAASSNGSFGHAAPKDDVIEDVEASSAPTPSPAPAPVEIDDRAMYPDDEEDEVPFDEDEALDEESGMEYEYDLDELRNTIRTKNKAASTAQKAEVRRLLKESGKTKLDDVDDLEVLTSMLEVLE